MNMLTTTLQRIITPPPVPVSPPPASSATLVTSQTLSSSLYLSVPSSASQTVANTRMKCITPHPSSPQVAYVLDVPDQKMSPQRQLIVQSTTTRQVLWKCSMGDLVSMLFEFDVHSTNGASKEAAALRSLGQVQGLAFFDTATLEASGMEYQYPKDTRPFQYIMVQFAQRIIILNLRMGPNSHALSSEQRLASPGSLFHPVVAHILETHVKATPTTMPIPLTSSLILIGCADGALRVFDFKVEKVIKSVRGPSGKDPIWNVIAANPYNSRKFPEEKQVKRVIAIGMKGAAYVWEIVLQQDTLIDIRPPVVRMDGTLSSTNDESDLEHTLMDYDAHRNYFLWFVPQKHNVLMWDLSRLHELKRKKNSTPKQSAVVCSLASIEGPVTVVAGWLHPAFPASALTCAVVTQTGELHVVCIPISESKPGRTIKVIPFYTDNLSSLVLRDTGTLLCPRVRVQSLTTFRRLDTSSVLVGSNLGLLNISIHEAVRTAGARHAHFGAGIPEWGKSVLTVDHSTLVWAQLDIPEMNPCGTVSMNSPTLVYKSPPALHLPPEIQKRAVRLPPRFLPSPSGNFLCLFWQDESQYEILHLPSILRRNDGSYSSAVSSGSNVISFAWVGDDDVFALLYPSVDVRTDSLPSGADSTWSTTTASTKDSSVAPSAGKSGGARGLRKSFNFINEKSRKPIASSSTASFIATTPKEEYVNDSSRNTPRVELKVLVPVSANAAEIGGSVAAATATILGDITLRGGNQSQPTTLYGGPVLCVASKSGKDDTADGGTAYFYTRKPGSDETRASAYISSGPSLPFPEFVEWDDDGRLCAVVVQSRVAIYLSEAPEFVLLGNVHLACPSEPDVTITSLKFIHGVLYCTTKSTVRCIFLGDLESSVCHLDTFLLASAGGPELSQENMTTWSPSTIPMTLNHPVVLGYQSGSLLLSTVNGLQAVPLSHPLLRIGTLLGAGQPARAEHWFQMIPECNHESLAAFVERRGAPELALQLSGLSLETTIDICLRFGFTERLEEIIDTYGLDTIRKIDQGRGIAYGMMGPEEHGHSLVVCVGAYLLSQGKAELVRRLATECLRSGEEGRQEAFVLASLLLSVDQVDAKRLVKRAVQASGSKEAGRTEEDGDQDYFPRDGQSAVVALVRNHILT
jgi:hypothetical protein